MEQRVLTALVGTICILLVIPAVGCLIHLIRTAILRVIGEMVGGETAWFIANRATFLGVVHHECAHALVAVLTGGKIEQMQLFHPQGDQLGCVVWRPRRLYPGSCAIQYTLVSIAPVVFGCCTVYLLGKYGLPMCTSAWQTILVGYMLFSIFIQSTMSRQDVRVAAKGLPVCAAMIFAVLFLADIDVLAWLTGMNWKLVFSDIFT
ncbi:M50 family metallopeptidase [Butyricicoccus sp.]|uniref:M50 family metallopeptidase n=1 Tax=Butyricicoccus sp. TaxID=2049021 RepID=UPI003D7D890F